MIRRVDFSEFDSHWRSHFGHLVREQKFGIYSFPQPQAYQQAVEQWADQAHLPSLHSRQALAQRDWHVRCQTGCMFARVAARDTDAVGWTYGVLDRSEAQRLSLSDCLSVERFVRDAITASGIQIVSILIPWVDEPHKARQVLYSLVETTEFWLEKDDVVGDSRVLYLRYPVFKDVSAWVMAFAPFKSVPSTRRAPYFELTMRVKRKPSEIFHRLNHDPSVAHLADAQLEIAESSWESRWHSSMRRTRVILGHEPDEFSAARATLTVPA